MPTWNVDEITRSVKPGPGFVGFVTLDHVVVGALEVGSRYSPRVLEEGLSCNRRDLLDDERQLVSHHRRHVTIPVRWIDAVRLVRPQFLEQQTSDER